MPASTSEADIVINRANVSLAKLQRLIASSLPPRGEGELVNARSEEEIEKEEEAIFTPEEDGIGLGFHVSDSNTTHHSISNDTLRKKLLGTQKRGSRAHVPNGANKFQSQESMQSKPRGVPRVPARAEDDEEDEEEGRGSLGKSKRRRVESSNEVDTNTAPEETRKVTSGSYLDEVLSEHAKRKKKKKKLSTAKK